MKTIKLTLAQAKEMYKIASGDMKILLESNFPELKINLFPKSHDELLDRLIGEDIYCISGMSEIEGSDIDEELTTKEYWRNTILTEQRAKEILALMQVMALYDQWCIDDDNYTPNWGKFNIQKYYIYASSDSLTIDSNYAAMRSLAFRTAELAQAFIDAHKDLLNQCKSLI